MRNTAVCSACLAPPLLPYLYSYKTAWVTMGKAYRRFIILDPLWHISKHEVKSSLPSSEAVSTLSVLFLTPMSFLIFSFCRSRASIILILSASDVLSSARTRSSARQIHATYLKCRLRIQSGRHECSQFLQIIPHHHRQLVLSGDFTQLSSVLVAKFC